MSNSNKKFLSKKRILSTLFGLFVFSFSSTILADKASSVFNYLTISELLAIDNEIALEQERENAERFGLTTYRSQKTIQREKELAESKLNKEKEVGEGADSTEGLDPLASKLLGEAQEEALKKEAKQEAALPLSEVISPRSMVSRLIGIYGTDGSLSALVEYEGELYQFKKGQKRSTRRTKNNALSLVEIKDNCVEVLFKKKTNIEYCL